VLKHTTLLGLEVPGKRSEFVVFLWGNFHVFDRRTRSRTLWSEVSFRVCSGPALASGLNDNKNDLDEENSPSSRETSQIETPQTNRHKKRSLNGRFTKASYVGKVIEPMANGLAAKRSLDENEPPTKRQTREDKAQYMEPLCTL
jgi:hypothetical protein